MNDTHRSIATEGHSSNLLGIPTGLLASVSFNDYPIPLSLLGVRKAHADLFDELSQCKNLDQARQTFHRYKDTLFELSNRRNGERRFHASYLHLLKDWGLDSSSPAGAVLKAGWRAALICSPHFTRHPSAASIRRNGWLM